MTARGQDANAGRLESPNVRRVESPAISLPKGGGAIRGIGEKFAANPVTGTGSLTVPIVTSPGRSGFGPQLSLSYDSGAGNGPFGFGWTLSLPNIARKTDKGVPLYRDATESDVFVLSGVEDLVPVLQADSTRFEDDELEPGYTVHRYRPRVEGLFARIERWTRRADCDVHWRSISRDNVLTVYGKDQDSRIADPRDPARTFAWLICETRDDKGNAVLYEYKPEDGVGADLTRLHERNRGDRDGPRRKSNRYLKRIRYGNRKPLLAGDGRRPRKPSTAEVDGAGWMFEVVFDYGEHDDDAPTPGDDGDWAYRVDAFSSYRSGFEVRTGRLCQRVLVFHHFEHEPGVGNDCLVRSTDFTYSHERDPAAAENPVYTFMREVTQSGYRRRDGGYLKRDLPPLEFGYSEPVVQTHVQDVDEKSLTNLPIGIDGIAYQWVDLYGEGIPGILAEQGRAWLYKRNVSPISDRPVELAASTVVAEKPNLSVAANEATFMDLAGDGKPDLVVLGGPSAGLYEYDEQDERWGRFNAFGSRLNVDLSERNVRLVDVNGDGRADVLIAEDNALLWYPSLGEEGFGPVQVVQQTLDEEAGPRLVFSDPTESIYLADLSGDGLTDLVRIRNGEVCYWPSLGSGFGAKVAMDEAPWFDHPDAFDHNRLRLADIDGTGTTDLIYLHSDGVRLYFNQSGNSWSAARQLDVAPPTNNVVDVATADLLGNGTACLVWSSPLPADTGRQLRYVDLMGQKPHLLVSSANNLGAETRVTYTPSTKFFLADEQEGKRWLTRLPFPVHVVERIETFDHVGRNRFVTRYAYHHGYYDGEEREFRGFGMVEQWDTEQIAALSQSSEFPVGDNVDAASHVPPVLTKTWFHTGVYRGRDHVSDFFAGLGQSPDGGEYYREPGLTDEQARGLLLPDTVLPDGLTPEEEREACRALKGAMLRQETYALDGTPKAVHPYTVSEQNFGIRRLQPRLENRHGVFLTHENEAITYQYERNSADPRIRHALTLDVDEFGNVLQAAAIGYGRRQPDPSLHPTDRAEQAQVLITWTESRVTTVVDAADEHRTPLLCESRVHELTGLGLPAGRSRFTIDEIRYAGTTATGLDYEKHPTAGLAQKRLIDHIRTYYRRNDLAGPLPLGELQSLALPFETYKLALTPGLVARLYGGRANDAMLENEGRYVHTEGDSNWWIASGRILYSPRPVNWPPQELAHARQHFFLPHRYRDPFHTNALSTESSLTYDVYDLLLQETCDALGSRVTVGERNLDPTQPPVRICQDYRVLQPALVMDPNRNRSQVAFDALGMVVGTAVMGKPEEVPVPGDRLAATFRADLTQAEIDEFFANPKAPTAAALLDDATTRVIYDLTAYARESDPAKKTPAATAALARETHASEPLSAGGLRIQVSLSYSDGFGREIQRKVQAEPGPAPARDAAGKIISGSDGHPVPTPNDVSPRWAGSGWMVFNNKGKPVRQYQPFFTDTHRFEFDVRVGVSPVLFYDPIERVVATLHPNHTWEKVVFDPWRQVTSDVNDTLLVADPKTDPDVGDFFRRLRDTDFLPTWHTQRQGGALGPQERAAAGKAAIHATTPSVAHADSLGRSFLTVAHNRFKFSSTPLADPPTEEFYRTRVIFDIEGNQREVIDAKDRVVVRYDYDMLGTRSREASMEAGKRWMLGDVAGKPIRAWDSRGHAFRTAYDALRRPVRSFVQGADPQHPATEILFGKTEYGEGQAQDVQRNLRTKPFRQSDSAGLATSEDYDFKGNLLRSSRKVTQNYTTIPDWSANPTLEPETFTSRTSYDALNRPVQLVAPRSNQPGGKRNIVQPVYNEASLLDRVDVWLDRPTEPAGLLDAATVPSSLVGVTNIDYDARGERLRIDYKNGATTRYAYDPLTFRLIHLYTRRGATFTEDCENPLPPPPTMIAAPDVPPADKPCGLQNLHFTYDPVGNITHMRDNAQQAIYFRNRRVEASAEYTYDAIYRLIDAAGREHLGQLGGSPIPHTHNDAPRVGIDWAAGDGNVMGTYVEQYVYDAVGNFLSMQHHGSDPMRPGWSRSYAYDESSLVEPAKQSNRLSSTTVGSSHLVTEHYAHDLHGNMTAMPHLTLMRWDFKDQLQATARQVVSNGNPETTYYVYDGAGQRVRKVAERQNETRKSERIYLGGFEVYREYDSNGATATLERETLHVMDDKQRIALVETKTLAVASPLTSHASLIRYQFGNHLGSASLELDDDAEIISYEEYTPYGSTSYQAVRSATEVSPKRYRYTGVERDEESGLNYHGARYHAPWLGRWVSADPVGIEGGLNLYGYCNLSPITTRDLSGTSPEPPPKGIFRKGWDWAVGHGKKILLGLGLATGEADEVAENVEKAQTELASKPTTPISTPIGGEPPDRRLATADDLHANRNRGKAEPAPDKRLATADDLHANRNRGKAEPAPDKRLVTGTDLRANRNLGNALAVQAIEPRGGGGSKVGSSGGSTEVSGERVHGERGKGRSGGGGLGGTALNTLAARDIASDVANREYGAALKKSALLVAAYKIPGVGYGLFGVGVLIKSRDEKLRELSMALGEAVENRFGSHVLGGVAAAGTHVAISAGAVIWDMVPPDVQYALRNSPGSVVPAGFVTPFVFKSAGASLCFGAQACSYRSGKTPY